MLTSSRIKVTDDFLIQRYGSGIKTVKPKKNHLILGAPRFISDLLQLPGHSYFLDTDSQIQNLNETALQNCGFDSLESVIGKTIEINTKKETALFSIKHDKEVRMSQRMLVKEQTYERRDNFNFQTISFKFPWYDENNKIQGIFGYSVLISHLNFSDACNAMEKIGLILGISPRTVEQYLEYAKSKLKVHSKAELLDKIYLAH